MSNDDFVATLANYVVSAIARPLPAAVVDKTKQHLLDTLAAIISGAALLPGKRAISYARKQGGKREATLIGTRTVTNAVNAALANAIMAHADETDDSHPGTTYHPGCAAVPAALAMAERGGRDGTSLLRAVTLGYDIGTRMLLSVDRTRYREAGRSTHALGSVWGATAAAGALAGLDVEQVRALLSYTAHQASGLRSWAGDPQHIMKAFAFAGMGARNAVAAATMVEAGWTGSPDSLSGEFGFLMVNGGDRVRPEILVHELGTRFEVMITTIKKWSVGSPAQAPLDAAEALIQEHRVRADDVARIVITLPGEGSRAVNGRDMPDLNIQHLIAVMLIDGRLTFESIHDYGRMKDSRAIALRSRAEFNIDEEATAGARRPSIVEFILKDGRHLIHRAEKVRGTVANPMPWEEVIQKADDLMAPVVGVKNAAALIKTVRNIESVADVRSLRPLFQPT